MVESFKEPSPSSLEACQYVNLIVAYVILREREDTHTPPGVLAISSAMAQDSFHASELVTANCVLKNKSKQFWEKIP